MRLLAANGARRWRYADTPVLEARFIPRSEALLVITTGHELVRLDGPDAAPRVILESTHAKALTLVSLDDLLAHARPGLD